MVLWSKKVIYWAMRKVCGFEHDFEIFKTYVFDMV